MDWPWILAIVLFGALIVLPLLISITIIPPVIFDAISKRSKPEKWSREHPSSSNPGIVEMWGESLKFRDLYKNKEEEIEATTADGLHLKGLYYDFGGDTCVMILGGRPETCIYALYYAYPYAKMGISVCAIDTRAHGLSEGTYSGCGYKEQEDIFAFVKTLREKGIRNVILHGICVGSSASALAACNPSCPKEIKGLVTDGLFIHYYETLIHRIKKNKGPVYPTVWIFRAKIKKLHGIDCSKFGPISELPKLRLPCLMMASKEDIFSLPKNTQRLYDVNGSSDKKLVWFEHGPHSHLRRVDPKLYDESVTEFAKKIIDSQSQN